MPTYIVIPDDEDDEDDDRPELFEPALGPAPEQYDLFSEPEVGVRGAVERKTNVRRY